MATPERRSLKSANWRARRARKLWKWNGSGPARLRRGSCLPSQALLPPRVNVATFACTSVSTPVPKRAIISYHIISLHAPRTCQDIGAVDRDACLHVPAEAESGNCGDRHRAPCWERFACRAYDRSLGKTRIRERGGKANLGPAGDGAHPRPFSIGGGEFYEEIAFLGEESANARINAR